jgi:NAD(P)-dependent dehydrogenase (short-subunit alcohol dehydrogenase family)
MMMGAILEGQVAIISGGLGDIGRAIAIQLAARGADIAVGDIRQPADAEPLIDRIAQSERRCRYDRVDVADAQAVAGWVETVEKDLGISTLIIPNAAIVQLGKWNELTPDRWRRELSINLDGAYHLAYYATQRLVAHGKAGRVVFIGSWAAHEVHVEIPAYCVSKAGMRMLCKCMAAELASRDILVNEVAPGYVDAGLSGKLFDQEPGLRERATARVPVRRLITSEEVAMQVAHLCDPVNRHMTGTTLVMDGGLGLFGPGGQKDE